MSPGAGAGRTRGTTLLAGCSALLFAAGCAATDEPGAGPGHDPGSTSGGPATGSGGGLVDAGTTDCPACGPGEVCHAGVCASACEVAKIEASSVGCEYHAVDLDGHAASKGGCFAVFVANTSDAPAKIDVTFDGAPIDLAAHARRPKGSGLSLAYDAFDPSSGLPPAEVAILFLAYDPTGGFQTSKPVPCPVPPALPAALSVGAQIEGTGISRSFRITTDVPVVAYQMLPYGGGSAAVTGASLLLPTSSWHDNYIAADAYWSQAGWPMVPSLNIVAAEDGTTVTLLPKVAVTGGPGVAGGPANVPITYALDAGQVLQIAQEAELTGSPIQSNKPVGLFAAHECAFVGASACDHMEQQIPPVRALGSEYVGVSYRPLTPAENHTPPWRVVGAVDGTVLTWDPPVGGPQTLNQGDVVEWMTATPFTVRSQDADHPFLLVTYMDGSFAGYGDADFVRIPPPKQYLSRYVFFTDPTYPETNLVVVRNRGDAGFADVTLDCAGPLGDWAAVGSSGDYEMTRIDLVRHDFEPQGTCDNGRREMSSSQPFGLWVWGWGGPETTDGSCPGGYPPGYTCYVSYGYPAGEGVASINDTVVTPVPK